MSESDGYAKFDPQLKGFVLGHGIINHPRGERINDKYRFIGLTNENGDWIEIKPHQGVGLNDPALIGSDNPWLETLGPGRLVFIPDKISGGPDV